MSFFSSNFSDTDKLEPVLYWTQLALNWEYNFYYLNLAKLIFWGILPTILLIYFNLMVYLGMKSSNNIHNNNDKQKRFDQEKKLSIVMIGIVFVFIICHSLRTLALCTFFLYSKCYNNIDTIDDDISSTIMLGPKWIEITWLFSEILLVLNSSVNTIIYCCVNARFRRQVALTVDQFYHKVLNQNSRTQI